jgi:ElaB/YqjD/DUF883 family membrane-anchored ribosome-binding protein
LLRFASLYERANLGGKLMEQQTQSDRTLNKMREIPSRAEDVAYDARARLDQAMTQVSQKARDAAQYAHEQVQANPWAAVGVGFGIGVVFGALLTMAVNSQRSMLSRL